MVIEYIQNIIHYFVGQQILSYFWLSDTTHDYIKGPEFLKYVNPALTTLQSNGGTGDSSDVIEQVIDKLGITEAESEETTSKWTDLNKQ